MCNGTGSVRSTPSSFPWPYTTRRGPEETEVTEKVVEKVVKLPDRFDASQISYKVQARLNKNEFVIFSRGILKHLVACDFRRAAASFNYLLDLSQGTAQAPEQKLYEDLQKIKRDTLDTIVENYQKDKIIDIDTQRYSSKLELLEKQFEEVYKKYF